VLFVQWENQGEGRAADQKDWGVYSDPGMIFTDQEKWVYGWIYKVYR
jgi:uncharacterized protein YukJ